MYYMIRIHKTKW